MPSAFERAALERLAAITDAGLVRFVMGRGEKPDKKRY